MNELLQAAKRMYDCCEGVKAGYLALCTEVAADAQQGVLRVFGPTERPVGLTVEEAASVLKARDEFAALWQQAKAQQQAKEATGPANSSRLEP